MDRLSDQAIRTELNTLPNWSLKDNGIARTFEFKSYAAVIAFVNQVAAIAEKQNHHPDLTVTYSKVSVFYTSHDAGGLTKADFDAARAVDSLPR